MYRYSEETEQRIKADRQELGRYDENRRIIRAATRGAIGQPPGVAVKYGDIVRAARQELDRCDKYFEVLQGEIYYIFIEHYKKCKSLEIVAGRIGRSRSSCDDLIKRQLAAVALDLSEGEGSERRRNRQRQRPDKRINGRKSEQE